MSATEVSEAERVRKLCWQQAKREGRQADPWFQRELTDKPIRRHASAWGPLPFKCSAPNSVFALGGMA